MMSSPHCAIVPVWRLDDGLVSSAISRSFTHCAIGPRVTKLLSSFSRSSVMSSGDPNAVAESALRDRQTARVLDAGQARRLTRVDRARHVFPREIVERGLQVGGRESVLRACGCRSRRPHGRGGAPQARRFRARGRGDASRSPVARHGCSCRTRAHPRHPIQPGLTASTNLVERKPFGQVLLGGPANLAVDDAVGAQILHELSRNSGQVIGVCMTAMVRSKVFR